MSSIARAVRQRRLGVLGSAGALVSLAAMAVNGLAYLPPLLAARVLTADQFGALAALLAVGAIATVPGLGLQTALAVRWARQQAVPGAGRLAMATAGVSAGALLVAAPVLTVVLHITVVQPILLALAVFPVVLSGFFLGELQGQQRFGRLALGMVILAVGRFGGLVVALAAGLDVTASLAVGAVGGWASIVALRGLARPTGEAMAMGGRLTVRDVTRAATATLAMLATSYADLILARSVLPAAEAGAYSVGAVLTKGALWAPGVVTVLALPQLAQGSRRALAAAAGCIAACGVVLVGASATFGGLAMRLAGGQSLRAPGPVRGGFRRGGCGLRLRLPTGERGDRGGCAMGRRPTVGGNVRARRRGTGAGSAEPGRHRAHLARHRGCGGPGHDRDDGRDQPPPPGRGYRRPWRLWQCAAMTAAPIEVAQHDDAVRPADEVPPARRRSRDGYQVVALVVIGASVLIRVVIAAQGYLAFDDFAFIGRAAAATPGPGYTFTIINNHLMPAALLVNWAITHTVGLEYWPYVAVMAVGEAILGLAFLRLARRLLPAGPPVVITLALLMFSPLTLETTSWWAVGSNLLAVQIAIALALTAQLSYIQTHRVRHLVELAASILLGLAFCEKALLIVALVPLATVVLFMDGGLARSILTALRRYAASWAVLTAIAVGYLGLYLSRATSTTRTPSSSQEIAVFLEQIFGSNVVPGLLGGPWVWLDAGDGAAGTAPPAGLSYAAWLVFGVLVIATVVRRRAAIRAWILLAGYLGLVVALLGSTRLGGIYSGTAGLAPRYVSDVIVVAALAIGIAVFGWLPLAEARRPPAPSARAPRPNTAQPPIVATAAAIGLVLVVVGSAWSFGGFADDWRIKYGRDYLTTVRAEFDAAPPGTVLYDQPVPEQIMGGLSWPDNMQSHVLGPLEGPVFGTSAENLSILDADGRIRPIRIEGRNNLPGPEAGCGYRIAGGRAVSVPLDGPLIDWDWVVRIAYISSGDSTATFTLGTRSRQFTIHTGLNQIFLVVNGPGTAVTLTVTDPAVTLCTNELTIGDGVAQR